jgi:hypothetical protein
MRKHVDLLGLLYLVWGALNGVLGVAIFSLGVGAAALITTTGEIGAGLLAGVTAVTLTAVAVILILWGGVNAWAGAELRRLRSWARLLVLVLAILNLFAVPFGTALGIYSLWVLLQDPSRALFEERGLQ